ncbi:hypothetical protein [Salinimonas chungwhensis]|uniref:hypothetical protein n=1 Tax=Salinimonas chungwhensis TaxID=265425 RepID=UPI00036E01E1|nr:hypothetical protein [Salinimonas chungwhensis]
MKQCALMFVRPKRQKQVIIDRQILHLHRVMAEKCLANPDYFTGIQINLNQRFEEGMLSYGSYLLWQGILEARQTPDTFRQLLLSDDTRTRALRRKTVFTGILTEQEREAALTTYIASEMA